MNNIPLAERLRPQKLSEFIGQNHLVGKQGVLKKSIKSGLIPSLIFWGPPGVGKTTLAKILANELKRSFYELSAINSGVKDIRKVIDEAENQGIFKKNAPILFIDEIHRFSKAQQDSLLAAVEKGTIVLIGATTENPSFEIISALISRCQVYTLKGFDKKDLSSILQNAIQKDKILKEKKIVIKETEALFQISSGDARKLLNALELIINSIKTKKIIITNKAVLNSVQENLALYDKNGEQHYDIISAFIKSIRGSDPNAAVYWLARMISGGEDPKFIARRLVVLASEDIGNANPNALVLANSCFNAVNLIGLPECRITLSQCTIYLACSPKSNASYMAINNAINEVEKSGNLSVPLHIRNAHTKLMKDLNYGKGYKYAHDFKNNFAHINFLPKEIDGTLFYKPGKNTKENSFKDFLKKRWKNKYNY